MSSFIHDIIKMKYVRIGYLPNYPYHLISDIEMCDAFLNDKENSFCFFYDNYPLLDNSLRIPYDNLVDSLKYHIEQLKKYQSNESTSSNYYTLPDWMYSYMMGEVLSVKSDKQDLHDFFVMLGMDNIDDEFNALISRRCLEISQIWLRKLPSEDKGNRSPTMFGEPHVLKYLRLNQVSPIGKGC